MRKRTWNHASRLTGRLLVVMGLLLTGASIVKATPVKTLVQDTLYRADGSAAQGNLTIRWNAFTTSAGEAVAAGEMTVSTGANGAISIPLIANAGATPVGGYYRVVIKLSDGTTSEEDWVIPATATTTLAAIRAQVVPQSVAAQFVNRSYVDGQMSGLAPVATSGSYSDLKNTPAIPDLSSPGAIGAKTPGLVNATDLITRNTPYADVRAYGGTCDGTADDTTAFQAAANALTSTGGTLYAPNCKIGAVSFPAYPVQTTLRIDRQLTLTTNTLVVPGSLNIEGVAGGAQTEFGIGALAAIVPPTGTIPTVQFVGDQSSMKNIIIANPNGYGLDFEFTNFHRIENVQVIVFPGNTTGVPVYIADGMDITFENCVFNQGNSVFPYVVHYTLAAASGVQEGSSIHFDHGAWLNYGMLIDTPAVPTDGALQDFRIKDVRYEAGNNSLLTLNTSGGAINGIRLDNVAVADAVGTWPLIYITPGNNNPVSNISIVGDTLDYWKGLIFNSNAPQVQGIHIENIPYLSSYLLGSQGQWDWTANGQTDSSLANLPLVPFVVPYATQTIGSPSSWNWSASTTNVIGPDGVNNGSAVHVSGTNVYTQNHIWYKASGYASGDWVIWGGWVKADYGVGAGYFQLALNGGDATSLDNTHGIQILSTPSEDGAWRFVSKATKITDNSGTGVLSFDFSNGASTGTSVAYPFVVYVPASAGVLDAEVIRWQRHLLKGVVPSGAAAGSSSTASTTPFNTVSSGTNTTATMQVGTGASLTPTGSGVITATSAQTLAQTSTYQPSGTYTLASSSPGVIYMGGSTVVLPTTGVTVGQENWIVNVGSGALTITNNGSADNVPTSLQAGDTLQLKLFSSSQWFKTGGSVTPSTTGTGAYVLASGPTFTNAPITPQGNTTTPGIQIGSSGYGFSNYAGNQLDAVAGGALVLQIGGYYLRLYNGSNYTGWVNNTLTAARTFTTPDGNSYPVVVASLTTTAATNDTVAMQGMTSTGHCSLTATNSSAAANHATTYVSAKTTNQITVTHAATAGMTYDLMCTSN